MNHNVCTWNKCSRFSEWPVARYSWGMSRLVPIDGRLL